MYDAVYKVVIFGDAGCGKTTLAQRFLTNSFKPFTRMTIGLDFEVKSMDIDGQKVKLQIWDFGGEERFRFLLPTYVRGANGALFMYDVTNYSSLAHIDDWLLVVRQEIKTKHHFPIIVVGGKADLVDVREVTADEGINIARSRAIDGFIECSSKTGENVEETFDALTRLMMQRVRQYLGLRFAEVSQPDVKQKKCKKN
ncbi:MAG: Rab family GTPase [Promethearchaeota archaeon]